MRVREIELTDFRCYESTRVDLAPGCTVVVGANGEGKTTLLEALGWAATGRSFRGVPDATLVRHGNERAIVRVAVDEDGRDRWLDAELRIGARSTIRVNGKNVARRRDLAEFLLATVFTPDDLALVKEGPAGRRGFLDDLLVATSPTAGAVVAEVERVLRQRNALLRTHDRSADTRRTLDVFDAQLAEAGGELVRRRLALVGALDEPLASSYAALADGSDGISTRYQTPWCDEPADAVADPRAALRDALARARTRELERGSTLAGPQRDDWELELAGMPARVQASQGEQRSLALALRLAGDAILREVTGRTPILLLDDVFSELDDTRSEALVGQLPTGQTLITTAGRVPEPVRAQRLLSVESGRIAEAA